MAWKEIALWYDVLGGQNSQHIDRLRQDRELVEFTQAQNVIPDPLGKVVTSPGFSKVRASAISGTPAIQGMFHMGSLADEFIIGAGGNLYRDNANPPGAISSGTNFTNSADVLLRGDVANSVLIVVSSDRGVPQQIDSSVTRSDLAGTPPKGIDYKYFGRRGFMFSPDIGGTVYRHLVAFNSADDDADAWSNPSTFNFLNFGRPGSRTNVLGGQVYKDHLMSFTEDRVYPIYQTPNAALPYAFQDSLFNEEGGGPPNIHAVVEANERLYWISRNFDVKEMYQGSVKSIGYPIAPFLRGLADSRRAYTIGGWEPQYRIIWWAVSDTGDTQNKDCVGLQVDTKQFYFRTISRNAFSNRLVSGELRLIGGGYSGFIYNEFDSSTTGDLDNSASVIDADIRTPRLHLGLPDVYKKCPFFAVEFDPIGSETVTVQGNLDDETAFSTINSSYAVSGTDTVTAYFSITRPFKRIQLKFRDANSGERFRVLRYGFPRPQAMVTRRT